MAGNYLIIGNGIAGHAAALAIHGADREGEITILAKEAWPTYSRILLTHYLRDGEGEKNIFLTDRDELAAARIRVLYNAVACEVDYAARVVTTTAQEHYPYDRLLVAAGADPVRLELPGGELSGVNVLRTLDDARGIAASIKPGGDACIVGAGLISLKVSEALVKRGMRIRLVVSSHRLLSTIMDAESGFVLEKHLHAAGFAIEYGADIHAFTSTAGWVAGAALADGREIPCDLAVIGKGVRPNLGMLTGTGLENATALEVNAHLETEMPGIFAAGDVASAYDFIWGDNRVNAIWPLAAAQGRLAGLNMAGVTRPYAGGTAMNSFKLFGLPVVSMGVTGTDKLGGEALTAGSSKFYRRLVFRNDCLIGMVTIGSPEAAGVFYWLMSKRVPCRDLAAEMLRPEFSYGSLLRGNLTGLNGGMAHAG